MTRSTYPATCSICSVGGMTEPLTRMPRRPPNGTFAEGTDPVDAVDLPAEGDSGFVPAEDSPPSTPRWVKALGVVLVVLLLVFAGLHLTGNAPTHMGSPSGAQHGIQLP